MKDWNQLADEDRIGKVVQALQKNGVTAEVVGSRQEAKTKVLKLIPQGAQVMTMSSTTLVEADLFDELESSKYQSVKEKLKSLDREKDSRKMQQLGAAPEYAVGSVHAISEKGEVVIASNSGSQIPGYAYGADKVIWVVGTQKLVADLDEAMKRIYEHCFPLEDARAKKVYGKGSSVSKLLIVNKEIRPDRITMILVKEKLGF